MPGNLEEEDQSTERGTSSFRPHDSRMVRILYLTLGIVSLVLAVLGVVLPVLPTTPFILLAAREKGNEEVLKAGLKTSEIRKTIQIDQ